MANCTICKRELDNPADPFSAHYRDGKCLQCAAGLDDSEAAAAVAEIERAANPPLLCVAVYLENRQYGGPEEGGWWYDAGELVQDIAFHLELAMWPTCWAEERNAEAECQRLQAALDAGPNQGRRSTSSMLSTGRYVARVEDFPPPLSYPAEKPRYE